MKKEHLIRDPNINEFIWLLDDNISKLFPEYFERIKKETPEYKFMAQFDSMLDNFYYILSDKEKYSLSWAFSNTAVVLHEMFDMMWKDHLWKELVLLNKKVKTADTDWLLQEIREWENDKENWLKSKANMFKFLWYFVMSLDIVVSIWLILVVTEISHMTQEIFSNPWFVFLFFFFVVLIKVWLDRFFIIPFIEKIWWRIYKKFVNEVEEDITYVTSVFLFLAWANQNLEWKETLDLINGYMKKIKK